jgi:hypothetical protein
MTREWYRSQWTDSRVRVGFHGVNPPVLSLAARAVFEIESRYVGPTRLRLSAFSENAPQLYMVGEPQGRPGQEYLSRRLPRDG